MLFIFVVFLIRFSWSLSSFKYGFYNLSFFFLLTFPQIALRPLKKTVHCQVVLLLQLISLVTVMRPFSQDYKRVIFPHSGDNILLGFLILE